MIDTLLDEYINSWLTFQLFIFEDLDHKCRLQEGLFGFKYFKRKGVLRPGILFGQLYIWSHLPSYGNLE